MSFNYRDFEYEVSSLLDDACENVKDNVRWEVNNAIDSAFCDMNFEDLLEEVWDNAQEEAREEFDKEVHCIKDEMWSTLCDYFTNPFAEDPHTVFSKYSADEFIERAMKDLLEIRVGDEVIFTTDTFEKRRGLVMSIIEMPDGDNMYNILDKFGGFGWSMLKADLTRTGRTYTEYIDILKGLAEPINE